MAERSGIGIRLRAASLRWLLKYLRSFMVSGTARSLFSIFSSVNVSNSRWCRVGLKPIRILGSHAGLTENSMFSLGFGENADFNISLPTKTDLLILAFMRFRRMLRSPINALKVFIQFKVKQ